MVPELLLWFDYIVLTQLQSRWWSVGMAADGEGALVEVVPLKIEFLNIVISKNNGEQVGVVFDRIIGSSDPEMFVDQLGNLSTWNETVLFLAFCSSRLILLLNWELWMILFSAEAILDEVLQNSALKYHE